MKNAKDGNAVIIILIVVVIIGLVVYFKSAPIQTKVNEVVKQTTEWTPENIQKNPEGYLVWSRQQCKQSKESLNANLLSMKIKKEQIQRELLGEESDLKAYKSLLKESKTLYLKASEQKAFPVELRSVQLNSTQLKKKIVEINRKTQNLNRTMSQKKESLRILEQQMIKTEKGIENVNTLMVKLNTDIEIIKNDIGTSGFQEISDKVHAIQDASKVLTSLSSDGEPSIESMIEKTSDQKLNDEFTAIMATD